MTEPPCRLSIPRIPSTTGESSVSGAASAKPMLPSRKSTRRVLTRVAAAAVASVPAEESPAAVLSPCAGSSLGWKSSTLFLTLNLRGPGQSMRRMASLLLRATYRGTPSPYSDRNLPDGRAPRPYLRNLYGTLWFGRQRQHPPTKKIYRQTHCNDGAFSGQLGPIGRPFAGDVGFVSRCAWLMGSSLVLYSGI